MLEVRAIGMHIILILGFIFVDCAAFFRPEDVPRVQCVCRSALVLCDSRFVFLDCTPHTCVKLF
jgi:hypothetical protein